MSRDTHLNAMHRGADGGVLNADDLELVNQAVYPTVEAAIQGLILGSGTSPTFVADPGVLTYDDTDPLAIVVTVVTKFGINAGVPYFNAAGVTPGDEAALMRDPVSGTYLLRSYNF